MTPQTIGSALVVVCGIALMVVSLAEYRRDRRWKSFRREWR